MKPHVLPLLLLALGGTPAQQGPFRFRDLNGTSLELTENGKPVYVYNYGMMWKEGAPEAMRRSTYLHPVYAPGGAIVTDDFPRDHYHHRGIFWTWPVVKAGGQTYDPWVMRGLKEKFERWTARETGPASARLGVENGWYAGDRKLVRENVEITTHPTQGNQRVMDFRLSLEALGEPVTLHGDTTLSKGQPKGYGGFSVRFAPREATGLTTDSGKEAGDTDMAPHPWAQLDGTFQGRRAGLRIDVDPANPGAPNGWCLRYYGFLGVNFPGRDSYTLAPGRPLVMRYRVTVHGE